MLIPCQGGYKRKDLAVVSTFYEFNVIYSLKPASDGHHNLSHLSQWKGKKLNSGLHTTTYEFINQTQAEEASVYDSSSLDQTHLVETLSSPITRRWKLTLKLLAWPKVLQLDLPFICQVISPNQWMRHILWAKIPQKIITSKSQHKKTLGQYNKMWPKRWEKTSAATSKNCPITT